jgi:hypothetical protein
MFCAKSLPHGVELSDEISIPCYHLNTLIEEEETLYVNMTNIRNEQSYLVTFGAPHNDDKNTIFVPQWILDIVGGLENDIFKLSKGTLVPIAEKIIIKPLDPIAFQVNTLPYFESAFMNLHSICEGTTLPVNIEGREIFAYIEKVEPFYKSRIINGEVQVEFINDFDEVVDANAVANVDDVANANDVNEVVDDEVVNSDVDEVAIAEPLSLEERRRRVREAWSQKQKYEFNNELN